MPPSVARPAQASTGRNRTPPSPSRKSSSPDSFFPNPPCLTKLRLGVYHWPMSRVAPVIPAEADLLCEFCGYTLNGLPRESNCPECGMPIASSLGQKRTPPPWESGLRGGNLLRFLQTSGRIIFHPTAFFRGITTLGDVNRAAPFCHI